MIPPLDPGLHMTVCDRSRVVVKWEGVRRYPIVLYYAMYARSDGGRHEATLACNDCPLHAAAQALERAAEEVRRA